MLIYVPLTQIDDNPFQRRAEYGDIAELASRIAAARESYPDTYGLMQVPRGRVTIIDTDTIVDAESVKMFAGENNNWNEDPKTFRIQLAFGHRRLRAFRHLHEAKAPGYESGRFPIHLDPLTDKQMLDAVWAENYERKDISAVEQAELIHMKLQQLGENGSHKAIGAEWGLSRPVISNRLRLLDLPDDVQQANRDGTLSERQCLALAPALRIDQLTNGTQWGEKMGNQWGVPAGPEQLIAAVIKKPDSFTSDAIRQHTKSMLEHAGNELPACIAKQKFGDVPGIEQPQCKGCQFRINQHCLDAPCLKHKLELWPEIALEKFSQESNLPISDRKEDFRTGDYGSRQRIDELYEAGQTDQMVCGWLVDCSAARPFSYGHVSDWQAMNKDGRAGIALGWRGTLPPPPQTEDDAPRYDLPAPDKIAAWDEEAPKIAHAAKRALLAAIADALSYQVAEFDLIQTLINPAPAKPIDDIGKVAKQLAKFLLNSGRRLPSWFNAFLEEVQAYQAVADDTGLQIDVLGNEKEAARKTAVLLLHRWYSRHSSYIWDDVANELAPQIAAWHQLPSAAASPMAEHIARAQRHIEEKLAAEGEEVGTAVSQEES